MRSNFLAALAFAGFIMSPAEGHEFWIDPVDFSPDAGEPVVADIRVGQKYEGSAYSYLPARFRLFEIASGGDRVPVESRMGDRPAVSQTAEEGLAVILHVTTDNRVGYTDFEKFKSFVVEKDAAWTLERHAELGFPTDRFGEAYSRYAKSLVAVGHGRGSDRAYGLETELVALANPYTDDLSGGMPVELYYRGEPRKNAQIEVFEKASDGTVTVSFVRTDEEGRALVPVRPGHRYMLDAVLLRLPSPELAAEKNSVWESLWANLTFAVPGS